jgi:hypothetical protein
MNDKIIQIVSIILLVLSGSILQAQNIDFYVATNGSDQNPGTLAAPFASVKQAKQAVAVYRKNRPSLKGNITVYLRKGIYFLDQTLVFTLDDSGTKECPVTYTAYRNEKVIISGGRIIGGKWEKQAGAELEDSPDEKAIWKLAVPEAANGKWVFRQLFSEGKRLSRASSVVKYTKGPLPQFASRVIPYDFEGASKLRNENVAAHSGFEYYNDDLKNWNDLYNAEILVYHSWECSWHQFHEINEKDKTVLLKSPGRYPVGFFANKTRYRVENLTEDLDEYGEWRLDKKTGGLYYFSYPREEPVSLQFIAPVLEKLLIVQGNKDKPVSYLTFENLQFSHTTYPLGAASVSADEKKLLQNKFPWVDFSSGYSDAQAAPEAGEAIKLTYANNCRFIACEFSHLGAYGISVGEYAHNNEISNSSLFDLGAGGVIIGYNVRIPAKAGYAPQSSPSNNRVYNNFIYNGGLVHPAAVAVLIMQANHSRISHNEIFNFPYSGISCGWTWGYDDNYTKANVITANRIHHVMTELADGGGIYTLGDQPGTVISNNYIHDIYRAQGVIGSFNNALFFDQASKNIEVKGNVTERIENQDIRLNTVTKGSETSMENMKWGKNYFSEEITREAEEIIRKAGHSYTDKQTH